MFSITFFKTRERMEPSPFHHNKKIPSKFNQHFPLWIRLVTFPTRLGSLFWLMDQCETGLPPVSSIWTPWLSLTFWRSFPWLSMTSDTDLMGIAWIPEQSEEKFGTCNHWVFTKICLEIRDKLWVTSARSFALTFPDSRQKILKFPDFPDFPWWWQPWWEV